MTRVWEPQDKQLQFMQRFEDEALYGGAAGGGKSDALVIEATRQVHIPYYKGIIFRKTYPQLKEIIDKSLKYYPRAFPGCIYNRTEHTWRFPSGAQIMFGSLKDSSSKFNYQGIAFDFIGFDELTHFNFDEYMYLLSRNRPNGPGTRCYMRATANPGGIGHGWVKERFVTAAPPMTTIWDTVPVVFPDGHVEMKRKSRVFVPASVFDNDILMTNDPMYVARLASLPEAEKNALLYGDWDSFSGQFFQLKNNPEGYDTRQWTHVINPFEIPDHWPIYRSLDWGFSRPFSVGWFALGPSPLGEGGSYGIDGTMYHILELYGCNGTPNKGVEWVPPKLFSEIYRIEHEHRWLKNKNIIGVADPAIFEKQTGTSIADTAARHQVYFSPGDHSRIPGWMQCKYRLMMNDRGYSRFYVFKNCENFIRTIPSLVFDDVRVEDCDTDGEDHAGDMWRYQCMHHAFYMDEEVINDEFAHSNVAQFLDIRREDITTSARIIPQLEIIHG